MPTNDERRDVAARLRFYADTEPSAGAGWLGLEQIVFGSAAKCDGAGMLLTHLADLIEPEPERTCLVEMLDTGNEAAYEHYEHIAHCHSCHHEFGYVLYNEDGDTWQDEPPNYCPNCGARVKKDA